MVNEESIHDEIKKEAENDQEEEPKIKAYLRRIFFFFVGLFLLYLSFSYLSAGLFEIFEGQIASIEIDEQLTTGIGNQTTIIFEETVYHELLEYYVNHQRYEFAACFFGNRTENSNTGEKIYVLTKMEIPHVYSQSVHRVIHAGCPAETLLALHTHPYKQCLFSEQDIASFFIFQQRAPVGIYALMCEENRFTFYGY